MTNPTNNVFKGVGNNLTGAVLDIQPVTPHISEYLYKQHLKTVLTEN